MAAQNCNDAAGTANARYARQLASVFEENFGADAIPLGKLRKVLKAVGFSERDSEIVINSAGAGGSTSVAWQRIVEWVCAENLAQEPELMIRSHAKAITDGPKLLSATIGGTRSKFTLFSPPGNLSARNVLEVNLQQDCIIHEASYENKKFESFSEVMRTFLSDAAVKSPPLLACLAVAGCVIDNRTKFVNLGWILDGNDLVNKFHIQRVILINNAEAAAFGILTIDHSTEVEVIQDAPILEDAPKSIIFCSTGLGKAFATVGPDGDYDVWPSEGGHADFAPRQEGSAKLQVDMLQYLQIKFSSRSRISVERVASGQGISNIYEFLAWKFPGRINQAVHDRWVGPIDQVHAFDPSVITQAARDGECDLCKQAVETFVGAIGAEAGVVALKHMPFGGIYLTGTVNVKNKDFILGHMGQPGHFLEAFQDKGRVADMLKRVPVFMMRDANIGERGARLKALRLFLELKNTRRPSLGHMNSMVLKDLVPMRKTHGREQFTIPDVLKGKLLLSADVGGTSSRLSLFSPLDTKAAALLGNGRGVPRKQIVFEAKYTNERFESFNDIMSEFLETAGRIKKNIEVEVACIAVAGAVVDNCVMLSNLGWQINGAELVDEFDIKEVVLINDFEAQGYGILTVSPEYDCDILQDAPVLEGAPKAVLGPCTGLGEAFLTLSEGGEYDVWPSEGGHAEFAPRQDGSSNLQFDMLQYLQIKFSSKHRISVERVVSGKGISNIYEFLAWKFPERVKPAVHKSWIGGTAGRRMFNPGVITQAANSGECDLCKQAIDIFVSAYGAEAGVIGLTHMPFGGIYLTGGVTLKTREFILNRTGPGSFMQAFLDKGRVSKVLRRIPVYIVRSDDMGERGAMLKAQRLFQDMVMNPNMHNRLASKKGHMWAAPTPRRNSLQQGAFSPKPSTFSKQVSVASDWSIGPLPLLSADVGGTSSRLHLFPPPARGFDVRAMHESILYKSTFTNSRFESFSDVLKAFLREAGLNEAPQLACLAVAGAIVDNKASFVNLGWTIDGNEIASMFGIRRVLLINDFEAQGYGILTIDPKKDCEILNDSEPEAGAPIALLGAGTGLGEAYLTTKDGEYEVWPSEGGHCEFAPRQDGSNVLQFEMLQFLQIKYSARARISVERICSGKGISNIYEFLAWKFPEKVSKSLHKKWLGPTEGHPPLSAAVITEAARTGECELARIAVDTFVNAYGSEAGVMALQYMPLGGLYLTGGVTAKMRDFITGEVGEPNNFIDAFLDKGRVSAMLERVPVYLVRTEDMGERGAMLKAARLYQEVQSLRSPSKGHMGDAIPSVPALPGRPPSLANPLPQHAVILSGDIGGTSSRLHLFLVPPHGDQTNKELVTGKRTVYEAKYRNSKFDTFSEVLSTFLVEAEAAGHKFSLLLACLAVAGVVVGNAVNFVNLGWAVDGVELEQAFGIARVVLINDFVAQGYGIMTLDPTADCIVLQDVEPLEGAPMCVLGPGTGLGEAFMTIGHGDDYTVWPAEGGHAEFAPRQDGASRLQFEMLQYLQIKYSARSRISIERIVSGQGISNIYEFLAWKFPEKVNKDVHRRWRGPRGSIIFDPSVITKSAIAGTCELSQKAVDMFVGAYGAEAGCLALQYMPFGGIYLTGGVTSKMRDFLMGRKGVPGHFMNAFLDKGRLSTMLTRIPVYLVCGEDMGERGAMLKAIRLCREMVKGA